MSTQAERHFRAVRHIIPIRIVVAGKVQRVDADVRRHPIALRYEEEEMVREVRRALNEYYYGQS